MSNTGDSVLLGDPPAVDGGALDEGSSWSEDLQLVTANQLNALFIGPDETVRTLIGGMRQHFAAPLIEVHLRAGLTLPPPNLVGTLVCYDIATLDPAQQRELADWLDHAPSRTRIISTAPTPVLPLVEQARFAEALYYRLNTVYVDLTTLP